MEKWSRINGFSDYLVSDTGKVFSKKSQKEIGAINARGYRVANLINGNKKSQFLVHRLVADAFIPNPEHRPYVCHKDGGKNNNSVANLYWGTHEENMEDGHRHGSFFAGERHPNSKLTAQKVIEIRDYGGTAPTAELASRYGVTQHHIRQILSRKKWKHI